MTEVDRERLAELALARAGAAAVLSTFFWVPVPEDRIEEWRDGDMLQYLEEYCTVLGCEAGEAIEALREAVTTENPSELERELNIDSTYLFRIGRDEVPASPYGSVWLEPEKLLMGTTTRDVAATFREYGVQASESSDDFVPDHVARELEFLAAVWRNEIEALSEGDEATADRHRTVADSFFRTLCEPWWSRFAEAVIENSGTAFFVSAARVLLAFAGVLSADEEHLPA